MSNLNLSKMVEIAIEKNNMDVDHHVCMVFDKNRKAI